MAAPVETKVKAAGSAALVAGWLTTYIVTAVPALAGLEPILQAVLVSVATAATASLAGWLARHTPRAEDTPPKPPQP